MAKTHQSLRGQLLLDGGKLSGSVFHRSVVLICQHDLEGAFGLILNQPTPRKLGQVMDVDLPESLENHKLFHGGPVQESALSFLHGDPLMKSGQGNVLPDLSVGHDVEELAALGRGLTLARKIRVFAGYAGWAPGQLDDEMRRESWLLHPASRELVFHTAKDLWQHILRLKGDWQSRLLADSPEDLSWN